VTTRRALFARFAPSLLRFVADLLGDHEAAADAAAEAFVRAFTDDACDLEQLFASAFAAAESALVVRDFAPRDRVTTALRDCSLVERAAYLLRADHRFARDAIARILGCSPTEVDGAIRRARRELRAQLRVATETRRAAVS